MIDRPAPPDRRCQYIVEAPEIVVRTSGAASLHRRGMLVLLELDEAAVRLKRREVIHVSEGA